MRSQQEQLELDLLAPKGIGLNQNLQRENTLQKVEELVNQSENHNFNYLDYSSYKIEVENGKISKIYFSFGKEKFLVYLNYGFSKKDIKRIDYTETNKNDREIFINETSISNLKILGIQKKVKVGYGEFKQSPNYFRYLGVDYNGVRGFIEKLLEKYHK